MTDPGHIDWYPTDEERAARRRAGTERRSCYWCQHPAHGAVCGSAMRAMDEEWRCPCDRAVSFRNGLIEDMIRNGWYHAESDLEQVEGAAVAAERARIRTAVEGLDEPDADEAFDFVNGREAWEAGWLAGRAAVLAIVNPEDTDATD